MTSTIETVARAIRAVRMQFGEVPTSVEHDTLPEAEARAAIAAVLEDMREPSAWANMAGSTELSRALGVSGWDSSETRGAVSAVWQAMLDQYEKENIDD